MSEKFDQQRAIDSAVAYFLAAERCVFDLEFGKYPSHSVVAPKITNCAFSVELVLKTLLFCHGICVPRTHSIRKLYDRIPVDKNAFLQSLAEDQYQMPPIPEYQMEGFAVPSTLDEIDKYFEDWRYVFEHEYLEASYDKVRRVFILCYQEVRRVNPELISIYEKNWGEFEPDFMEAFGLNSRSYKLNNV